MSIRAHKDLHNGQQQGGAQWPCTHTQACTMVMPAQWSCLHSGHACTMVSSKVVHNGHAHTQACTIGHACTKTMVMPVQEQWSCLHSGHACTMVMHTHRPAQWSCSHTGLHNGQQQGGDGHAALNSTTSTGVVARVWEWDRDWYGHKRGCECV